MNKWAKLADFHSIFDVETRTEIPSELVPDSKLNRTKERDNDEITVEPKQTVTAGK